ncbi:DUF2169 family type VI secretion system accessory protein [Polyangium mundeleinium]|uniref:DUF2169 domain-containing protein n=1 Tax=Polyangium mundeleinium TaxID=2995306 RepID=A0ABT5EPC5_9BACT|nr:DUF2169 domain-containing protein [Polyangium mundeleinium]MDC0742767.1 DUF2169 domain-containing protein [Polyangium mundeleinium]
MLRKNLTPFLVGTKLTSRRPPQPEMTVVVRATYAVGPGGALTVVEETIDQRFLSGETFVDGDDDRTGESLFPSDFADYKLNAEVFFKGHCHAAGGVPLTECLVRFAVGAWSKTLRVVGRRAWSDKLPGAVPSAPLGFTKMPLTWANAFGGSGFPDNPVGKGLGDELPSVEYPDVPVRNRGDRPIPAGFGPVSPFWPARAGKLGKDYGKTWQDKRSPFYAEDLDWTHFHAAPPDQQLPGYLRGDEELLFQNLSATEPTLRMRLPGTRVRAFVHDDAGRFREVPMSLDTLLADLDRNVLELTFRGIVEVREHDFEDVRTMLVAQEQLGTKPLPEAHYRDILLAFEKDPVGLAAVMPPDFADVIARAEAERRGELPPLRADLDPVSAKLDQKLGAFGAGMVAEVGKSIAGAREKTKEHRDIEPELAKAAQSLDDAPPSMTIRKPGVLPPLGLRKSMRGMLEEATRIRKSLSDKDISADERAKIEKKIVELEAVPHDPRWKEMDPAYSPPTGPVSTDEPGPGRDLSEQDLTGRDLRGLDLRGVNLEGAILTRADLSGADLSGANLRDAVLFKTNLEGARLVSADLRRANLARVRAKHADFTRASLETAFFEDGDLEGAMLAHASGPYVVFTRTNLVGARAEGADFERADFTEAILDGASFERASLVSALLSRVRGRKARLTGARIGGASFHDAHLVLASLADTSGEKVLLEGANLEDADLSHADLPGSHFTRVSATAASFVRANLPGARFYKAKFDGVDATQANFFQADFSRALVSRTKFVKANLYESNFTAAQGKDADFNGANLKQSTLERGA